MVNNSPQTDALLAKLRPAGAAPSPFARGGQVKQLPGGNVAGTAANIGASTGAEIAGKALGTTAAGAAAGAGIATGTGMLADKIRVKEEQPTFGGEFGDLTDNYGRRFQGTGGGKTAGFVRGAGYGANPGLVAATGGISVLAGGAIGAGIAAAKQHAPSAYTDFRVEDAAQAIQDAYQKYLGRAANDDEIQTHLVNQGWDPKGGDRWVGEKNLTGAQGVLAAIKNSPEAQVFAANGGATGAGAPSGPASDPTSPFYAGPSAQAPATAALAAKLSEPVARTTVPAGATTLGATGGVKLPGTVADGINEDGSGGITGRGAGGIVPADTATAATPQDTSGWDTDGYAAPAYTPPQAGPVPDGWDATKWNDPTHQTPKYGVGRILSNFPPTVQGLTAAIPDIEKAYPGTTFDGKDKLTIPGVGTIDVLKGASKGGEAWRWDDGSGASGAQETGAARAGDSLIDASGGASNQGDVMAIIAKLISREGQSSPTGLTQALLNQVRQTA